MACDDGQGPRLPANAEAFCRSRLEDARLSTIGGRCRSRLRSREQSSSARRRGDAPAAPDRLRSRFLRAHRRPLRLKPLYRRSPRIARRSARPGPPSGVLRGGVDQSALQVAHQTERVRQLETAGGEGVRVRWRAQLVRLRAAAEIDRAEAERPAACGELEDENEARRIARELDVVGRKPIMRGAADVRPKWPAISRSPARNVESTPAKRGVRISRRCRSTSRAAPAAKMSGCPVLDIAPTSIAARVRTAARRRSSATKRNGPTSRARSPLLVFDALDQLRAAGALVADVGFIALGKIDLRAVEAPPRRVRDQGLRTAPACGRSPSSRGGTRAAAPTDQSRERLILPWMTP